MLENSFQAAMTEKELHEGEQRYSKAEKSRKLAMAAGLTKNSDELLKVWTNDQAKYATVLEAAINAYEDNESLEELLRACVARLVSVVDTEEGSIGDLVVRAMEIVQEKDEIN